MSRPIAIRNARIATPGGLRKNSTLVASDGLIDFVGQDQEAPSLPAEALVADASGLLLLPGLIDLHTDALEKEITPRPGADFPLAIALREIERKFLACGVTTIYHSLHLGYRDADASARSSHRRSEVFATVAAFARSEAAAHTKTHLRFEITGVEAYDQACQLVESGLVDLLSLMDHTPGQGQYPRDEFFRRMRNSGLSEAEIEALLQEKRSRDAIPLEQQEALVSLARQRGIKVASHDDDSAEKTRRMSEMGVSICEFPVALEAAKEARALGMAIAGGAPNALRGASLSGNLKVVEALAEGCLDALCSDYYPPAMLHAVFSLWLSGLAPLRECVNLCSLNPAKAAGIEAVTGSLEPGKQADFLLVDLRDERPRLIATFVAGALAHASGTDLLDALRGVRAAEPRLAALETE